MYAPFLGQLAKLVFLASSMHQLTISIFSTLPFVIGQVSTIPPWTILVADASLLPQSDCRYCHECSKADLPI